MTETTISHVRLSGRLPKGDLNGLTDLVKDLVANPGKRRVAVVTLDVEKTITVVSPHDEFPVVKIHAIEAITNVDDSAAVLEAMRGAYQERTGNDELPLDTPDESADADGDNVSPISGGKK